MDGPQQALSTAQNHAVGYFIADFVSLLYASAVYFTSFVGPAYLLWHFRSIPLSLLVLLALAGWIMAMLVFVLTLILTKRVLVGEMPVGCVPMDDPRIVRWFIANKLICLFATSPFRFFVTNYAFFTHLFCRGMGAEIHSTTVVSFTAVLTDPWAVKIGRRTILGHEACILGHMIQDQHIYLDRVEIGNDVTIGVRALIWPGVKIGNGAIIGANAVVARGTVVPSGEVWAGIPARKVDAQDTGQNFSKTGCADEVGIDTRTDRAACSGEQDVVKH
jgi:acetyltransferase-like isoleucine patch superfamily enzyme